jgi:hypothetical protein
MEDFMLNFHLPRPRQLALKLLFAGALIGCANWTTAAPKALLVGIDGAKYERIQALNTPNFDRLAINRAYTGGIAGESSQQATYSGPGWGTILTGNWAHKHQVTSNSSGLANPAYPSIFKRLKQANSNLKIASIVNWSPINTQFFTNDVALINTVKSGLSDANVVSEAIAFMNGGGDFTFVHLDGPDHAGHSYGFGSSYDASILTADQQLGQLLNAVDQLTQTTGDDWLVLVTTDHGRESSGFNHGSQTYSEKSIFIASNKALNQEFSQPVTALANTSFNNLYGYAAQTSITPTLLRHLGVEPQANWLLDGLPLIGSLGVRKVMKGTNKSLAWYSDTNGTVDIFRNGTYIESQLASALGWDDVGAPQGTPDYTLVLNNTPVSYRGALSNVVITAALNWSSSRAYFFRSDNRYVRYNKTADQSDAGYPIDITNTNWSGVGNYKQLITASFNAENGKSYFFLSDGNYIQYDNATDKADTGYPKSTSAGWPGLASQAQNIRATLRWTGNKVYFFFANGTYSRFDLVNNSVDSGYPKPINNSSWPGLGDYAMEITEAIKWSNTRAYFFLSGQRYVRYSITNDSADAGYPTSIDNSSWPGLLNP